MKDILESLGESEQFLSREEKFSCNN